MLNRLIEWSIRNRLLVLIGTAFLMLKAGMIDAAVVFAMRLVIPVSR